MFTGIITDIGRVRSVDPSGDPKFTVETAYDTADLAIGASVLHNGICLTIVSKGPGWFEVQVSPETLRVTTAGSWQPGTLINLERSLKMGDELGGHIVSGHVDGMGRILAITPDQESLRIDIEVPPDLAPLIAKKGSIAVEGVSLTVNEVSPLNGANRHFFAVNIIPHTQTATTLGTLQPGTPVNLEIDMLARYVARLLSKDAA